MNIDHFDPMHSYVSHEGTILAADVAPQGMHEPFEHAYGYLLGSRNMAGHAHETDEIYIVTEGSGYVVVGGQNRFVTAGDIIAIPPTVWHTQVCTDTCQPPYTWAALWWPHIEGNEPFGDAIVVTRYDAEKAECVNGVMTHAAVAPQIKCPFTDAFCHIEAAQKAAYDASAKEVMVMMLEGTAQITVEGETATVKQGDVIGVPANAGYAIEGETAVTWAVFAWEV